MKTKKLISLLCAAAMTVSSFAGLTITASAVGGDKIADVVETLNFNSTENFAVEMVPGEEPDSELVPKPDAKYDGVLANGTDTGSLTVAILTDGTAVKTVEDGQTAALTLVTCTRNGGDRAWYTDDAGELIKTGSYYAIEQKEEGDNYLHMSWPFFGDFGANGRWAHVDFPSTYTADAEKDYVVEFDAKFINGMIAGKDDLTEMKAEDAAIANPVLRLGTFNSTAKTANAVDIDKTALNLGDGWVHIKTVTSTKGTKVFVGDSDVAVVNTAGVTAIAGFGLYTGEGMFGGPPLDVKGDSLKADNHRKTPAIDIDNLTIYTTEPEKEANVTVTYKDGEGNELKTASTLSGIVGKQFVLPENYKASIDAEGDNYYKYASGADAFTVADGENAVNLVFTSTPKPTVTFNAVTGEDDTVVAKVGEAKAMPGTKTETIYAHEYIQDEEGNWYQKVKVEDARNNPIYGLSATAGEESSAVTVAYVPVRNVVYFAEAEDTEGTSEADTGSYTVYSANYPRSGASGGKRVSMPLGSTKYADGFKTAPVTAGTYDITVAGYDSAGKCGIPVSVLSSETDDLAHATKIGEISSTGMFTETFTVELEEGNCFYVGKCAVATVADKNDLNAPVDYIVVKKASAVPEVEIAYANGKATLTVTNADDVYDNVDVKLIHASYTDGAVSAVNVYDAPLTITADGMGAEVTIPETDTVYKGDKLMVWDSLEGMKPLAAALDITEGTEKPVDPSPSPSTGPVDPSPAPTYTVTVASTENGRVEVDKTSAAEGDTVTITATPDDGYAVATISVKDADNENVTVTDGAFTMPAKNVTVTVTFAIPTYTVTIDENITGGTVEANKTSATAGATVTLTVTPDADSGYVVGEVKYNDTVITADEDGVYSFTMPAEAVTVTATFTQLPELTATVTVSGTVKEQQLIEAVVAGAPEGATLKYQWMTATEENGTYTNVSGATNRTRRISTGSAGKYIKVVVTADGYRGSVESAPQQIAASEEEAEKYAITASASIEDSVTEITIKVDDNEVTEAEAGASVTIAATVATGYQITGVTTDDDATIVTKNDDGTYSFEMPEKEVAVTVNTVAVYAVNTGTATNGTFAVSKALAKSGDEITVRDIVAEEGYAIGAVKYNGTDITAVDGAYKFTMPSESVEVTVEFVKKQYAVNITTPDAAQGTLTVKKTGEGTPAVNNGNTLAWGDTFTVTAEPAAGYENPVVKVMNGAAAITADENGVYTMPKAAVTISVEFTKAQYGVTVASAPNGTVKIMDGETELDAAALADVAADKSLTISATANDGYGVASIAVKDADNGNVTVTDGAFTMPAKNVTVTVTFASLHFFNQTGTFATPSGRGTTISLAGNTRKYSQTDNNASMTVDTFTESVDLSGDNNTIEFDAKFNVTSSRTDKSAQVVLSFVNSDNKVLLGIGRTGIVSNSDAAAKELMYYAGGAVTESRGNPLWGVDANGSQAAPFNTNSGVTAFSDINKTYHVKAVVTENELIVSVNPTDDATNVITKVADISDVGSKNLAKVKVYNDVSTTGIGNNNDIEISNETITATATHEAVVNVKNSSNEDIAGATVIVGKRTATTDAEGKATLHLPNGTYAYSVSCNGYQTKTDGSFTVTGTAVTETATLANSVPTSITITSPDNTQVTTDAGVQFTAKVYDEENREMSNVPLTWSIVDSPANITVTDGLVEATAGVTAGNYTVKAAVTANDAVNATAAFSVVTAAGTKITVKYQTADGTDIKAASEITENVFVGESYTVDDSYKATFDVTDETARTFKRYTYVSGDLAVASPVANNNDVVLTFATDGVDYYYYEDFASTDIPAGWSGNGTRALESDGYLSTIYSGSGSRNSTYMFGENITNVTSGILKISFKYNRSSLVTMSNRGEGQFAILKKGATKPNDGYTAGAGDTVWSIWGKGNNGTNNANLYLGNWVVNDTTTVAGGSDGLTYEDSANTIAFAVNTWYTAEIYVDIDNQKTSYIVKDASGATTKAEYNLSGEFTGISGIHVLAPRSGGKYGIDDIKITKASAMPTAE